jgi:predicted TIM-barrel fold metal-dependent hydrolase
MKMLSADAHVIEPPNLWQDYIEPRYRSRAPRVERVGEVDQWLADGEKFGTFGATAQAGVRFDDPRKLRLHGTHDEVRRGGYDPHEHVKDMDADGISGDVIYPTQSLTLYNLKDSALISACCRAYNDWMADFAKPYPNRLRGMAILNVDDPVEAAADLRRAVGKGLGGALIPLTALEHRYDHPSFYEPLWAAAEETGRPLILHTAAYRNSQGARGDAPEFVNREVRMRAALAAMIFGGVFERYPGVRVGVVEFELSWFPYFIRRADSLYLNTPTGLQLPRFKNGALPSDHARRSVFITFQEDEPGIQLRHYVGIDNILWGSDYPHAEGTFPNSRTIVQKTLHGVPEDEQRKILWDNTARIFGFD